MLAIRKASPWSKEKVHFFLDSEFVVKQVKGDYRARDVRMRRFLDSVLLRLHEFDSARVSHVPRENPGVQLVDRMVNEELDRV